MTRGRFFTLCFELKHLAFKYTVFFSNEALNRPLTMSRCCVFVLCNASNSY